MLSRDSLRKVFHARFHVALHLINLISFLVLCAFFTIFGESHPCASFLFVSFVCWLWCSFHRDLKGDGVLFFSLF